MSPSDKMTQSSSFLASIAYIGSNILHSDGLSVYKCKKKSSCFVSKHEDLVGRSGGIRTHGLLVPNQTRYQTALHLVLEPIKGLGPLTC